MQSLPLSPPAEPCNLGTSPLPRAAQGWLQGCGARPSPRCPCPDREPPKALPVGTRPSSRSCGLVPCAGSAAASRGAQHRLPLPAARPGLMIKASRHKGTASPLQRWLFLPLLRPVFVLPSPMLPTEKVLPLAAGSDAAPVPAGTSICSSCAGMRVSA